MLAILILANIGAAIFAVRVTRDIRNSREQ